MSSAVLLLAAMGIASAATTNRAYGAITFTYRFRLECFAVYASPPSLPPAAQDSLHVEAGTPCHGGTFTRKFSATYPGARPSPENGKLSGKDVTLPSHFPFGCYSAPFLRRPLLSRVSRCQAKNIPSKAIFRLAKHLTCEVWIHAVLAL